MEKVYDKCCGIDVHKKLIVACFRKGNKQEVRDFGATTRELLELADWLKEGGCEMVAMESTASYWKPLYNILESSDLKAMVVNARHMKAVPGRKTDVKDAEWIADLLQHGLLQPSYIPAKDQRELRELVRYRKSLVGERGRELNRLQKMLEGANIKLSGTVSDINGKSARSILEYLITGASIDSEKHDNVMYALHFYAATHKESLQQTYINAVSSCLPVFVTEFGICDASGSGAIDKASANKWLKLLDKNKTSYCMWNISNKAETSAIIRPEVTKTSGFTKSELTAAGKWFLKKLK